MGYLKMFKEGEKWILHLIRNEEIELLDEDDEYYGCLIMAKQFSITFEMKLVIEK